MVDGKLMLGLVVAVADARARDHSFATRQRTSSSATSLYKLTRSVSGPDTNGFKITSCKLIMYQDS